MPGQHMSLNASGSFSSLYKRSLTVQTGPTSQARGDGCSVRVATELAHVASSVYETGVEAFALLIPFRHITTVQPLTPFNGLS